MMPRIPTAVWSALGPVPVAITANVEDGALGSFTFRERDIKIDAVGVPATKWGTFWHELVHLALYDSGVTNGLAHEAEEAVCDAVGSYLAGMTLAGCLTVRAPK